MKDEFFDIKKLKFSFNLKDTDYQLDVLQNRILEFYLRADSRFRRAFSMNYTQDFLQYLRDKVRLREPVSLAMMGNVRTGKSYIGISICAIHQAFSNRKFSVDYICANAMEFLEKLQNFPEDKLKDRIFLIDEQKIGIYGVGSIAKKVKIQDVQNIVAINNISTIMINPISWANKEANYGLRSFGRCFNTKTCRLMLYNLQEKGAGGELPLSCIFIPIFVALLPKDYADEIEIAYLKKKNDWVKLELRGEGDILAELRKKSAENFIRDKNFLQITNKHLKLEYISQKLGSEWTTQECKSILDLTILLQQGLI